MNAVQPNRANRFTLHNIMSHIIRHCYERLPLFQHCTSNQLEVSYSLRGFVVDDDLKLTSRVACQT